MAELGTIRRYAYWSDRRIRSIATDNGINLQPRSRLSFRTPTLAGMAPQAELAVDPKAPQRHDVALKIESAIGQRAVEDFVTPPPTQFAKGVGTVTFAAYTRWSGEPAVVLHTRTVSSNGQRVEVCLFGSIENCAEYISGSTVRAPYWSASSTWAIEEFLKHKGRKPAPTWDDAESIAMETLRVLYMSGMMGKYVRHRILSAEWFAEIYHDVELTKERWSFKPGVDMPEPVDRILIGAPLWVRSNG